MPTRSKMSSFNLSTVSAAARAWSTLAVDSLISRHIVQTTDVKISCRSRGTDSKISPFWLRVSFIDLWKDLGASIIPSKDEVFQDPLSGKPQEEVYPY